MANRTATIVVYNQQFESQRLWELAGWLPQYAQRIREMQTQFPTKHE